MKDTKDAKYRAVDAIEALETFTEREKIDFALALEYLKTSLEHKKAGRSEGEKFYNEKFEDLTKSFLPTLNPEKRKAAKYSFEETRHRYGY